MAGPCEMERFVLLKGSRDDNGGHSRQECEPDISIPALAAGLSNYVNGKRWWGDARLWTSLTMEQTGTTVSSGPEQCKLISSEERGQQERRAGKEDPSPTDTQIKTLPVCSGPAGTQPDKRTDRRTQREMD
ncbi:unnamed protein product [Pleuronectes platessa]|uniref:Uncharacterized protein n=1 Tax=Pleuronectes platessa TaxID=8262 RepID=A0A9N7Z1R3_PLEPL|nr:unnamed protein product [Pleuronectes platessa]